MSGRNLLMLINSLCFFVLLPAPIKMAHHLKYGKVKHTLD